MTPKPQILASFLRQLEVQDICGMQLDYATKAGPSRWAQRLYRIQRNLDKAVASQKEKNIAKWQNEKSSHLLIPFQFEFAAVSAPVAFSACGAP